MPLAATLATADVFAAFAGAAKTDALLHGHSYSGHAIGLSAAAAALEIYTDPAANPALCAPPHRCRRSRAGQGMDWAVPASHSAAASAYPAGAVAAGGGLGFDRSAVDKRSGSSTDGSEPSLADGASESPAGGVSTCGDWAGVCEGPCGRLVEMWDPEAVAALSMHPDVARVVAIGAPPRHPPPSPHTCAHQGGGGHGCAPYQLQESQWPQCWRWSCTGHKAA